MTALRRRDLIAGAGAAALVLVRPGAAVAQFSREADVLTRALHFEHASVFAYDAVLGASLLRGEERGLALRLRRHEAAHAEAVARALGGLGWPVPRPPDRIEEVEVPEIRAALDALRDRDGAVKALTEVEALSLDAYEAVLAGLREGRFLQLAATIVGAEAAHAVAWRAVG